MVSHFLVFAFTAASKTSRPQDMCLQGLGFSCRVWMVNHFLVLASGGSFENLKPSGRMCLQGLGVSCRVWMVSHFCCFALSAAALKTSKPQDACACRV